MNPQKKGIESQIGKKERTIERQQASKQVLNRIDISKLSISTSPNFNVDKVYAQWHCLLFVIKMHLSRHVRLSNWKRPCFSFSSSFKQFNRFIIIVWSLVEQIFSHPINAINGFSKVIFKINYFETVSEAGISYRIGENNSRLPCLLNFLHLKYNSHKLVTLWSFDHNGHGCNMR